MMSESKASTEILLELERVLLERRGVDEGDSYTRRLMTDGSTAIKRKIGEEAVEVVLCAENDRQALCHEITDLWFHCMVLMAYQNLSVEDVMKEFSRRFGAGGLEEKALRGS